MLYFCDFTRFVLLWNCVYRHVHKIAKSNLALSCTSIRLPAWNKTSSTGWIFMQFGIWVFFFKICQENSSFVTVRLYFTLLYMKTGIHFGSYLAQCFLEWRVFPKEVVEKLETHFLFSNIPPSWKLSNLWQNVEKYCRAIRCYNL
jgi:hypothetical protein